MWAWLCYVSYVTSDVTASLQEVLAKLKGLNLTTVQCMTCFDNNVVEIRSPQGKRAECSTYMKHTWLFLPLYLSKIQHL